MRPGSRTVHAGYAKGSRRPLSPPITQTSVYVYDDLEDYDSVARGESPGHYYARNSNENVAMLAAAVADLEGAEAGTATSSGMAAILVAIGALAPAPCAVVAPLDLYGGTWTLFRQELAPIGYSMRTVDFRDLGAVESALDGAGLVVCETITNPLVRIADLEQICRMARERDVPVLVDNTFATPILCRPIELGASLCVHSATKYIGGHSDLTAGVTVGSAALVRAAHARSSRLGTTLGPFEAWLALRGLRTLDLRVRRMSANALALAEALQEAPGVIAVHYPSLAGSAQEELAARLLPDGAGGMLAFQLDGPRAAVQRMMSRLQMVCFAASLAGVETTISHPEVTSHRGLSPQERAQLGIHPGTVRVSAGIEEAADIIEDFQQALA
ncbi:MAG: aminotransferase class I/II-fold pyridoxal phosphate-dependent enzyme [Candidatus Dormibacteraeota bacterium]|nr:aminotransferase class I/II-fold pyridoxal phosphate-dependent enzyme [Candidatus Dormibacteraeota bacterium]